MTRYPNRPTRPAPGRQTPCRRSGQAKLLRAAHRRTAAHAVAGAQPAPSTKRICEKRSATRSSTGHWMKALVGTVRDLDRSTIATSGHQGESIFTFGAKVWSDQRRTRCSPSGATAQAYDSPTPSPPWRSHPRHQPIRPASGRAIPWACNKTSESMITTFADNSRHANPGAAKGLHRRPRRGHDHPNAHPHTGPALDPRHLGVLERTRRLQPGQHWQRRYASRTRHNDVLAARLTQGVMRCPVGCTSAVMLSPRGCGLATPGGHYFSRHGKDLCKRQHADGRR